MEPRSGGPGPPAPSDSPNREREDDGNPGALSAPPGGEPDASRGLPGLLLARAAAQPEQPWLFVQRGLDWRWRSFGAVAARVERLRAALAEGLAGRSAGIGAAAGAAGPVPGIGFEDDGSPDAIALDLAIQAAGACAAPLPPGLPEEALPESCLALARFGAGSPEPLPRVPVFHLATVEPSFEIEPSGLGWLRAPVLVDEAGRWREVSPAELLAETEELSARLAPPKPTRRRREILVLPRPLADPAGRRLAAWSLAAGAALVLEPDRPRLAATAAWVRPTVFAGDPAEIAALRAEVEARRSRRARGRGLPFRRLHTVAVVGGEPLPAAERAFWIGRGTAVTVV